MNGFMALLLSMSSGLPPALALPDTVFAGGTTSTVTTAGVTATVTNGITPYAYAWSKLSGGTVTIGSPAAATTTFSGSSLAASGESRTAVMQCVVTDGLGRTASDTISVTVQRYATLLVSVSGTPINHTGSTSTVTSSANASMTVSGGSGSSSKSWVKVSGDSITAVSSSSSSTAFRATGMVAGESRSATFRAHADDNNSGQSADSASFTVTLARESSGPTFSPTAGTRSGVGSLTITASSSVTWTYTRLVGTGTVSRASGTSGTSITFTDNSVTTSAWDVTATWSGGSASWSISVEGNG